MEAISTSLKLSLYRAGQYSFPVPPVLHGGWTELDWINYIDAHGRWGVL